MPSRQARSAFTLVELLVVISIIGMLMALLFPAVQAARETGRQNTCRNNLRNLALATVQYEKKTQTYPGFVNELYPPASPPTGTTRFSRRSWIFMLLPHLERSDLYEYNLTGGIMPSLLAGGSPPELDIVKCPTNPNTGKNTWASCSFVCNTGLPDAPWTSRQPASGTGYPGDWSANGVFHDYRQYQKTSDIGSVTASPITRMTEGYISTGDGTSNTIMLVENADAVSWYLAMGGTDGGSDTDDSGVSKPFERQVGCNWSDNGGAGTLPSTVVASPISGTVALQINSQIDADPTYVTPAWARPAALHPNIVNVAFCDGHVRTLSQDISYTVYALLMAPRNRNYLPVGTTTAIPASVFRTTVLNEGDIH